MVNNGADKNLRYFKMVQLTVLESTYDPYSFNKYSHSIFRANFTTYIYL